MTSADFGNRLQARAAQASLSLTSDLIAQLEIYCRLLTQWNRTVNLTALQLEPLSDSAIDRLLVEPLAAASYLPDGQPVWFDLGSGGGSPAIPMKIARAATRLTMIESRSRKAAFLREVVRELSLAGGAAVLDARFEAVGQRADLAQVAGCITARALRIDAAFLEAADRLLQPGGRVLLFGDAAEWERDDERFRVLETAPLLASDPRSRLVVIARNG